MMENHPILRSLVAEGRPLGTERPASLPGRATPQDERFDRHLDEARRAQDEPTARAERRATKAEARERSRRTSQAREDDATQSATATESSAEPVEPEVDELAPTTDAALDEPAMDPTASTVVAELDEPQFSSPTKPRTELRRDGATTTESDAAEAPELAADAAPSLEATPTANVDQPDLDLANTLRAPTVNTALESTSAPDASPLEWSESSDAFAEELQPITETSFEAQAQDANGEAPKLELASNANSREMTAQVVGPREGETRRVETAPKTAVAPPPKPEAPVGHDRAADILRQIRLQLSPELRQATIQLEPRELGRLSIRVAVRGDAVHAQVRVDRRETLEALEKQVPELRAALQRAGFGGEIALQLGLDERRSGDASRDGSTRSDRHSNSISSAPLPRALVSALAPRLTSPDGVDTYA